VLHLGFAGTTRGRRINGLIPSFLFGRPWAIQIDRNLDAAEHSWHKYHVAPGQVPRDAAGQVVHRQIPCRAADCDGRKFSVRERQVDGMAVEITENCDTEKGRFA
jgi:hypothetical protein